MLDHIGFVVSEFDRSKRFYSVALAPLSISLLVEVTPEQTGLIGPLNIFHLICLFLLAYALLMMRQNHELHATV